MTAIVPTLKQYLRQPLTIGAPDVVGPLAVFPLFGPEPRLEYLAFAQAVGSGVSIHELERGASVNDLTVFNPTDKGVLLYDGEEVLGAQQNRTFDVSVLVPAGAKVDVPVSCVEHGRWDGTRHADAFMPAPQAAYPELRRAKSRQVRHAVAAGMEPRAAQGEVWDAVARKHERLSTESSTGAMHDIYEQRRDRLEAMRSQIALHDGQLGALVAIGGRFSVVDHVSRPDVYSTLHGPLVQGYALDALDQAAADGGAPGTAEAQGFIEGVSAQRIFEHDGIGMGRDARFESRGIAGSSLVVGDELVQLTAFADDDNDTPPSSARSGRIRRPSRRRAG